MNKPTLKPYTLPSRSKSPLHDQNMSKSMSLPTQRKRLTKFKENKGMNKALHLTISVLMVDTACPDLFSGDKSER